MSCRYLRPGVLVGHLLVLAAVLTCLRLGWWQWGVAHASRGTVQNLGYALLWPVFAGAFIYMWLRFLHLESVRDAEMSGAVEAADTADDAADDAPTVGGTRTAGDARGAVPISEPGPGAEPTPTSEAMDIRRGAFVGDGNAAANDVRVVQGDDGATGQAGTAEVAAAAPAAGRAAEGDQSSANELPDEAEPAGRDPRRAHQTPSQAYTIAVATVGDDDDDDPELAAYNRALAALAEQDRRRAR